MKRASFVKRFVVLALAIVLPNVNWSAFRVSAAEGEKTITASELVAKNYELTEAEEDLLNSGMLVGAEYKYTEPTDAELISIDTDKKTITAGEFGNWIPVQAEVIAEGESQEIIKFNDEDVVNYLYDGNMFKVEVTYALNQNVPVETQKGLLDAISYLKSSTTDIASLANAKMNGNLGTVATALPALEQMAAGFEWLPGRKIQFDTEAQQAYAALQAQYDEYGKLALSQKNADTQDMTATEYAVKNGMAYKAEVENLYALLNAIRNDEVTSNPNIVDFLDAAGKNAEAVQWAAMIEILDTTIEMLEPVANAEWATLNTTLFGNVNWNTLDTLVAAVAATTTISTFEESLNVAVAVVSQNASMYNVTVNVALYTAETKDSTELTKNAVEPLVLTLAENATPADIEAAIKASGIEEDALKAWGADYVAEGYERTATKVTANLTQDMKYVIEYKPVDCKVTFGMGYTNVDPITVPYGYDMTLPVNEEEGKAYDYTIDEVIYAQGSVYEVKGDITVNRAAGKAYNTTDLYTIIAANFAADNDIAKAILESGALNGNVTVSVRKPDPTDAESMLKLEGGVLTAVATYPASYNELNWVPYTYGETGSENEFAGTTAEWAGKEAKVQYVLELKNFDVAQVEAILADVAELKADAVGHLSTMNGLMGQYGTIEDLDDVKLAAMSGIIGSSPLVDTNGDGIVDRNDDKTAAANIVMQQYFKTIIDDLLNNSLNPKTGKLRLYDVLTAYNAQGLKYYYQNAEEVKAEVDALSAHLTAMMDDEAKMAALEYILVAVGYADYVEKLATVEQTMAQVSADLTLPSEKINLNSANLDKLMTALLMDGEVITEAAATPYLVSDVLTILDSSMKNIQVVVDINGQTFTVTTPAVEMGTVISQDMIDKLNSDIDAEVAKKLGNKYPFYEYTVSGDKVVVGAPLEASLNQTYTYTAKKYTVDVAGTEQIITADNLTIALEKHASSEYTYKYVIDGQKYDVAYTNSYTFNLDQLATLFANGSYTVTREEINLAIEKLETNFDKLNNSSDNNYEVVKNAEGEITGLNVTVVGDQNGIMNFVEELVSAGYSYIALNDEPLVNRNADNELELSVQTLINALLADTTFGSQTLIDLGNNNGGVLLHAKMQLGNVDSTASTFALRRSKTTATIDFDDLDFVLKLDGTPSQMQTVAKGLNAVKSYMSFQSAGDHMDVTLNLPEKVYEAYLVALIANGTITQEDVNAIDNQIAFQFFYDYIELVIENEEVTAATFENTLKKLDNAANDKLGYDLPDYDLSAYDPYYQMLREALTGKNVNIDAQPENCTFDFAASGESILKLVDVLGIDISSYEAKLALIKELKDGGVLEATVVAELVNTSKDFEAALIDVRCDRTVDKADFVADLPARLTEVEGAATVMLLDTIDGNLVFNGTTVLDLNGQVVNGDIIANGKLIIVDSRMSDDGAGRVNGKVSGSVAIIGGAYAYNVSSYLKDGYETVAKELDGNIYNVVQNKLYSASLGDNGELVIDINTGIMHENIDRYTVFAAELATDIAVDLIANYYNASALYAEGKELYGFDFYDFVDLVDSDSVPTELLNRVLGFVNLPDTSEFINIVIEDLLDFGAIQSALINNQPVATYTLTTAPWMVELEHIAAEDYLTVGIGPNLDLSKSITISLQFNGEHADEMARAAGWLDKIVDDDTYIRLVDVEDLTYTDQNFNLTGGAKAHIHLDLSDYTTAMAIVVANGLSSDAKASADKIIDAVNNGNEAALKDQFDKLTVKDVFDAIKVLNRNDDLQALADKIGMNVTIDPREDLETLLVVSLSAAGKALEKLDVTGCDATLGNLDLDDDGIYEWDAEASRSGNPDYRGYGVKYNLTVARLEIVVDLFNEDCLWGDMDHDNDVDNYDATLVLQYYAKLIPAEDICLEKADVNDDGAVDNMDATLILQHYAKLISKFPVEQ